MSDPETPAGRELLRRHPELGADEVSEVEREARGQQIQVGMERRERVIDGLRHVLTPEQLGAVSAVLLLDPDTIAKLDDEKLQVVLGGLARLTPDLDPEAREAAREAAQRYLNEIM